MANATDEAIQRKPLRLWPGVVAVVLLVGDLLLVRNSQEMAAFRLTLAGS